MKQLAVNSQMYLEIFSRSWKLRIKTLIIFL